MIAQTVIIFSLLSVARADSEPQDPHLWLEGVEDEKALEWVKSRNEISVERISQGEDFTDLQDRLQNIYDSEDRIPYVSQMGEHYYNFWRDADHPRGLWRRTTLDSYRMENPVWEIVLDLDELALTENENWVWHGSNCLPPEENLCIIGLSRGGADADVKREFNVDTKSFVEGGFELPEAKSRVSWIDEDHVIVGTDFGEGSLTESGYPRTTRIWTRGTPLSEATLLMEGNKEDVSVGAYHTHTPGYEHTIVYQGLTFYTNRLFLQTKKGLVQLEKQDSAELRIWKDRVFIELREDWEVDGSLYTAGSLLTAPLKKWLKGKKKITVLFEPSETTSLSYYTTTKDHLILMTLEDVKTKVSILTPMKKEWATSELPGLPELGRLRVTPVDSLDSNDYWLTVRDYITPDTLHMGSIGGSEPEFLKSLPSFFDADNLKVSQHFTTSKDGTRIPYFQIAHADIPLDGSNPTLLYGYGGFEVSLLPYYSPSIGAAWLEKGGVYVVANIRGGGEYGPKWHQAALKEKRHKAYEDFVAVGEDLVQRKITTPEKLGIKGGSNGGLLMGNMYTLYPEHWGAIVCQVPLLDMKRYTQLLAGASWAGEYGDPTDPEQWKYIQTFSPYHNINSDDNHPPMLITTSTRDDRVHPGHARKMTAALEEANKNILYYENIEGGHGGSANNEQAAFMSTLAYMFLWDTLNPAAEESTPEDPQPQEQ
ncbi:MAG: S9 family peptidase [Proteobacteria bacterium]|nr:S9 family peptidase [Pseudomonadota bacterium]